MIDVVTSTLVGYLAAHATGLTPADITVAPLHGPDNNAPEKDKLTVCCYSVAEHGHMRNRGPVLTPTGYVRPPLGLRLRYLMVYEADSHEEVQAKLAAVIQAFYTTPILSGPNLDGALAGVVAQLTVRLHNPSAEELNQVWTALSQGMRLALFYEVDALLLAPEDGAVGPPILREEAELVQLS